MAVPATNEKRVRRGGLGRGLAALIPGAGAERGLLEIPVNGIVANPRQPRRHFDEEAIGSLAASINEVGVLQPIIVRERAGGYELVAGERRLRAARLAGLATIPAVIREGDDAEGLREALIENVHREDLGPLELAAAFQELLEDLGVTQETLAERLGCSRTHVTNTIRLLSLPPDVQRMVMDGRIQAGHARALLTLPDDEARSMVALRAVAEGLSVRQVEELVRSYAEPMASPTVRRAHPEDPRLGEVRDLLADHLATRVTVSMGARRGRIVVEVGSVEDLDRVVGRILGGARS